MNSNSFLDLTAAYYDASKLLSDLDKYILYHRELTASDPVVSLRWQLSHWLDDYSDGEIVSYGDYLAMVARAQTILEGDTP